MIFQLDMVHNTLHQMEGKILKNMSWVQLQMKAIRKKMAK